MIFFFFSSRRRHTRYWRDWSSDVCSSDLFTGAADRRIGCFELANNGTLLLDELAEMPVKLQAKLLRVLEDRSVRRLGGSKELAVDVRVIAATNQDPIRAVKEGRLREDLLYR